jgi:hypothetical protein
MQARRQADPPGKLVPFDAGRGHGHRDGRDAFHRRDLAAAREDLFQAVVSPALPVPA